MTGKWTNITALLLAVSFVSGCSSLPEQLKFAKKDKLKTDKAVNQLNKPVEFHLSYAQWQEETGNLQEASESYRIVLSKDPGNTKARLGLARVSMNNGDLDKAEALFNEVLKVSPSDPEVLDSLGQFYAEKKDWPRSVAMLDQAVRLDPGMQLYRYHYAAALAHFGKDAEAIAEFCKILSEDEAHFAVADICKKQGNWRLAEYHIQQSLTINPKYAEARQLYEELKAAGGEHTRYARNSSPATAPQTYPAGYEQRPSRPAATHIPQHPATLEYSEERINPLDY